jgi:predicted nucleic acid-binding protein
MSSIYLLDTDFIIAFSQKDEANYLRANEIYDQVVSLGHVYASSLVLQELATVLSAKWDHFIAIETSKQLIQLPEFVLEMPPSVFNQTWQLFFQQTKKRTSFVDCSNVVFAQHLGAQVVSFDHFYTQFPDVCLVE